MKLSLENIGKIKKADIELNGITIIAGDNNTGKSTINKVLFTLFNSCYKIENEIQNQQHLRIKKNMSEIIEKYTYLLSSIDFEDDGSYSVFGFNRRIINNLVENYPLSDESEVKMKFIKDFISEKINDKSNNLVLNEQSMYEEIVNEIDTVLNVPIETYRINRIENSFNTVFNNQIVNIFNDEGSISSTIKNKTFNSVFNNSRCTKLDLGIKFTNKAVFVDDTDSVILTLSDWKFRRIRNRSSLLTLNQLHDKKNTMYDINNSSDVDRTIVSNKLADLYQVLDKAVKGIYTSSNSLYNDSFLFEGANKSIKIENLSNGVKSILLLKKLCEGNFLSVKDVLILDEPEVHLHPEWQVIYAHAIVLLQKNFDLTVLITSHSPIFIRAIECYCDIYERMDLLDVYKTQKVDDFNYTVENLSYSEYGLSSLYEDFSMSFDELEELIYNKYNDEE